MAKNKDLKLDDAEMSSELDFDFDFESEMDGVFSQEAKATGKRAVVNDVVRGSVSGAVGYATDPAVYKDILKRTLPKSYGTVATGVSDATKGAHELYDQAAKELKPRLNSIITKIDQLVPDNQKTLKGIMERLDELTGGKRHGYQGESQEERDESAIANVLGEVFQAQVQQDKTSQMRELVRDSVDKKRYENSTNISLKMQQDVSTIAQYTTNVTQAFQKKSLEIQLRSYMGQREFHAKNLAYMEATSTQLEAIVKNTALPEFLKITKSERFMEHAQTRFLNSLYGEGSAISKMAGRLKKAGGEVIDGVARGLDMANIGIGGIVSQKEMMDQLKESGLEISKAEMLGMTTVGFGMDFLKDKVVDKAKPWVDQQEELKEKVAKAARMARNPNGFIQSWRETDEYQARLNDDSPKGKLFKLLDGALEVMTDRDPSRSVASGGGVDDLDEPTMGFDKRAHISLTNIIPGHLSLIHREIAMLRTGKDMPRIIYDYSKQDFVSEKVLSSRIMDEFKESASRSGFGRKIVSAQNQMTGDKVISEQDRLGLQIFLSRLTRVGNMEMTLDNVRKTDAYQSMPESVQKLVDEYFLEIENSFTPHQKANEFEEKFFEAQAAMPSLDKEMAKYIKAGYGDVLSKTGILKRNEDGSRFDIDEDSFYDFIEKEGVVRSDINVKEKIKPTNPESLLKRFSGWMNKKLTPEQAYNAYRKTSVHDWEYKKGKGKPGLKSGPMAQDVRRNFGEDAAPDGKSIDLQTMNGNFFAAVQYLGDKVESAIEGKDGKEKTAGDYLQAIVQNTHRTNLILLRSLKQGKATAGSTRTGVSDEDDLASLENDKSLFSKILTGAWDKATTLGSNVKNNVLKPAGKFISETYEKNKDPAKERLTKLFNKATEMAGNVLDFGGRVMSEHIPAGLGWVKRTAQSVWKNIKQEFGEARDLYLPDGVAPAIRATKLKMGFYVDQETGEPLTTVEQIMACKNNIVDQAGNIVLSLEDRAKGLYDAHGEKIKGKLNALISGAIGLGRYGINKSIDLAKGIKNRAIKSFGDLKDFFKDHKFGKDGEGFSFGLGGNLYAKKTHDVAVDIRDIMLGEKDEVMKRLKKEGKKLKNMTSFLSSSLTSAKDAVEARESKSSQTGEVDSGAPVKEAPDSFGMFRGLGEKFSGIKDKAMPHLDKIKDRFQGNVGKLRDRVRGAGVPGIDKAATEATGGIDTGNLSVDWGAKKGKMLKQGSAPELVGPRRPGMLGKLKGRFGGRLGGIMDLAGGALSSVGAGIGGLASGLSGMFGNTENQDAAAEADKAQALKEGEEDYSKVGKDSGAGKVAKKDRAWNDKNGDGDRDGGVDDRHEKIEQLAEARKKKAQEASTDPRYKSSQNVIDKMMAMATGFLGGLKEKIGGLVDVGASLLSNLPGLGKIGTVLGKGWATVKGMSLAGLGKSAALGVAKTAGAGYLLAAKTAVTGAATLGFKATVALGGSLLSAISAPVVIGAAALAAAGFGLYKLYKYANRNNASEVERARLRQYGFAFNNVVDRYNHLPYMLEAYLYDGRLDFSSGQADVNMKKIKQEEMLEIFKIDEGDSEQIEMFKNWFKDRFKPVFLTHVTKLSKINPKFKLQDINKLTDVEMVDYLEAVRLNDGPYSVDYSPVKGIDGLDTNREEINKSYDILIQKFTEKAKGAAKQSPLPILPPPVSEKKITEATKPETPSGDKATIAQDSDRKALAERQRSRLLAEMGEGDGTKAPSVASEEKSGAVASGSIAIASGAISEGSGGMQYIKLLKDAKLEGMSPSMLKHLLGMAEEYGTKTGKSIPITDGIRTYAEQAALYAKYPNGRAARPGRSLHEFGVALDMDSKVADELDKMGLMKKYGFTRPVGQEPWHVEPAGIQKSIDLARKDANEREKMVQASLGRGGGGYGTIHGANKYRRNHDLAMQLLMAQGVKVEDKATEASNAAQAGLIDNDDTKPKLSIQEAAQAEGVQRPTASSGSMTTTANEQSKSQQVSNYGPPAANDPVLTEDAEGKQDSAGGLSGESKGGGDVKSIIEASAKKVGIDPNIALTFAAVESDMNPNAKARTSSAAGLFQFINSTWKEQLQKNGSKYGFPANTSPFNPEASAVLGAEYLKSNMRTISSVKPNPNAVDMYLTHFLGPGGARTFLSANPNAIAAEVMPKAAKANRGIFYSKDGKALTIAQVYENIKKKLQTKSSAYGIRLNVSGPGLKAPKDGEGGTGLKSDGAGVSPNLPGASASPAPMMKEDTAGSSPGSSSSGGSGSGLMFDTRNPVTASTEGRSETGTANNMPNMSKIEVLIEQSVSVQTESLKVLKSIDEKLNHESLAKVFADAASAAAGPAKEETVKEKDNRAMGRTTQATGSSVDLSRKSA